MAKVFRKVYTVGSGDNWFTEFSINQRLMNMGEKSPRILECLQASEDDRVLLFPYCPHGDIFTYIERYKFLDEALILKWIKQMVEAVYYLHEVCHIAHMDLSLENFLVTDELDLKLCDFAQSHSTHETLVLGSSVGKSGYNARELYDASTIEDTKACDMWSLGICIFNLFFRFTLWTSVRDKRFALFMKDNELFWQRNEEYLPQRLYTPLIMNWVKRLICLDPSKRMTISEWQKEIK